MNLAYLMIGGNIGDRLNKLRQSIELLQVECGSVQLLSSVYETAAWGKTDQQPFLNQAIVLSTALSARQLLSKVLWIEEKMGRRRKEKYGSRIIDIDILFFNEAIINEPGLVIPHPHLQHRRFALAPLNEIAPAFLHPVLHKTIGELLSACSDVLPVKKL